MSKRKQYCYDYPRPALTSDCIILRKNKTATEILLIQRAYAPYKGYWALPGGFVDPEETTQEAARRELYEETGIDSVNLTQLHTFSELDRDPRGRTVSVVYYSIIENAEISVKAGDDASNTEWFSLKTLPKLAFDHSKIIEFAIEMLDL